MKKIFKEAEDWAEILKEKLKKKEEYWLYKEFENDDSYVTYCLYNEDPAAPGVVVYDVFSDPMAAVDAAIKNRDDFLENSAYITRQLTIDGNEAGEYSVAAFDLRGPSWRKIESLKEYLNKGSNSQKANADEDADANSVDANSVRKYAIHSQYYCNIDGDITHTSDFWGIYEGLTDKDLTKLIKARFKDTLVDAGVKSTNPDVDMTIDADIQNLGLNEKKEVGSLDFNDSESYGWEFSESIYVTALN